MNNFVYLILTNVPDCTDSTLILFSQILLKSFFQTRVCLFELSLAKFFTDPYCAGGI